MNDIIFLVSIMDTIALSETVDAACTAMDMSLLSFMATDDISYYKTFLQAKQFADAAYSEMMHRARMTDDLSATSL